MKESKRKKRSRMDAFGVADRLHSVAIHLLRRVRKQDTATGEGPARLSALSVLVFGGPLTLGQLAAAEQVKPPTMTRIVAGLERGGLAHRTVDSTDARRVSICATTRGALLLQEARQRRIQSLADHFKLLTDKELTQLNEAAGLLDRILSREL
jgi:DNA-binding MarR family transcriptional regulator